MSHVKNAESYSRLVDICTGFGGKYNPGRQSLQLKAMRALLLEAQSSLQYVSQMRDAYNSITNERSLAFVDLDVQANRVIGLLIALNAGEATINDARYFARLIGGKRATPRLPLPSEDSEANPLRARSYTQLSYVARADNFFQLAQMVRELPAYITNEPELQVGALMKKASALKQLNEGVAKAAFTLKVARAERNRLLYKGKDAMINIIKAAKRYVKVVYGANSVEANHLMDLSFTKLYVK